MRDHDVEPLRRRLTELEHLIDQAADGFFVHDRDGNILDVNAAACQSLGFSRDELLSMNVRDIEIGFTQFDDLENLWSELDSRGPITVEGVHKRKDGVVVPVEVRIGSLDNGSESKILALVRDISARKEAEDVLRKREQQLAESQAVARLGSWDRDLVSGDLDWSDETYRLFDEDRQTFTPSFEAFAQMVHPEDRDRMQARFDDALASDEHPYHVVVRINNETGRECRTGEYLR